MYYDLDGDIKLHNINGTMGIALFLSEKPLRFLKHWLPRGISGVAFACLCLGMTSLHAHAQEEIEEIAITPAPAAPSRPADQPQPLAGETAAPVPKPMTREEILRMRESFFKRIAKKLEEADLMLEGGNNLKLATLRSGNSLPENELLIFRGVFANGNLRMKNDMYAIVRNERLMISLGDFINAADLAITVSPGKGTATGWFIREDQDFFLDAQKREFTVMGQQGHVSEDDIYIEGDDFFLSSAWLEKWFGIQIDISLVELIFKITTSQPFPLEERIAREKLPLYSAALTASKLPLMEEPYSLISTKPYFDVALDASYDRPGSGTESRQKSTWSVTGAGDLAGFSTKTFASGIFYNSSQQGGELISNLRQTFSRADPDGNLLGSLHASEVSFGDVASVPLHIGGRQTNGIGVRLSNKLFSEITSLNNVDIQGDALPGWEVELLRDEASLGLQTVGSDGRYLFPGVFLFAGNNTLKLVFYGPQGEVREEIREIYAGTDSNIMGGKWDVSAVQSNTQLYGDSAIPLATDGDMNLTASYEYSMGALGTSRAGVTSYTLESSSGEVVRKNILTTGYSWVWNGFLFSGDTGYDLDGAYASGASMRYNLGRHLTGVVFTQTSEGFATGPGDALGDSSRLQAFLNGPLGANLGVFTNPRYNLTASHASLQNGSTLIQSSASLSGRVGSLGLSTGLSYSSLEDSAGEITPMDERLTGSISASGKIDRGRWRLNSSYDVQPVKLLEFTGEYTYPFTRELEGAAELRHQVASKETELDLSANWLHPKFTLTPRLTFDNDKNISFTTSMRFGLAPDPYNGDYTMHRNSVTNSGGVASRIFLDANGDGIYTKGEKLIDEAEIRAVQTNRSALSDKDGIAFIHDLPRARKTDVVLSNNSLPDVYYISLEDGRSVIPRPGVTSKIDFPVVIGGEVDGEVEYQRDGQTTRQARNAIVTLNTPFGDGADKGERSEQDGYYSLSAIRPGFYYLTAQPSSSSPPGYTLPVPYEFQAGGTTFFGQKVRLKEGANVGFVFSSTNQPPGGRKARVVTRADIASQKTIIHVGQYHSRIGLTVGWYKFRLKNPEISDFFNLAKPFDQLEPNPATGIIALPLIPNVPLSMEQGAQICENIYHAGFACTVETVTTYHDKVQSVAASVPAAAPKAAPPAPVEIPEKAPVPSVETPIQLIDPAPTDQAG